MKKIVDTALVLAMLMTSVPGLAEETGLQEPPAAAQQAAQENGQRPACSTP